MHLFIFSRSEEDMKLLAIFVSQLIREGVTFKVGQDKFSVEVELTGGY